MDDLKEVIDHSEIEEKEANREGWRLQEIVNEHNHRKRRVYHETENEEN